jgi:hypothetical protein
LPRPSTSPRLLFDTNLRRQDAPDGRTNNPRKADGLPHAIDLWVTDHQAIARDPARPANVQALQEWLRRECDYGDSYKSVLRFVRAH